MKTIVHIFSSRTNFRTWAANKVGSDNFARTFEASMTLTTPSEKHIGFLYNDPNLMTRLKGLHIRDYDVHGLILPRHVIQQLEFMKDPVERRASP